MTGMDYFDSVLTTLIAGVCSINLILFLLYIIFRISEKNDIVARSRSAQNKADRPFWVVGCLISGTIWMTTTLLLSGDFNIYESQSSYILCVVLKVVLQYTFGYILWINLIIYRLFRLFMVHAWVVKPLHAMVVLSILLTPFLIFSAIALSIGTNCSPKEDLAGYMTCTQGLDWSIPFYLLSTLYMVLFVYLAFKVSKVTGTLKDLKRYIFFCGLSFFFLIFDALLYLSNTWQLITLRRLLCFFVFCIVTAQSWSIFWSVLIRKRVKKPKSFSNGGDSSVMVLGDQQSDATFTELFENEISDSLEGKNHLSEDEKYQTEKYYVRHGLSIPRMPREAADEIFVPETSEFSDQLTSHDTNNLPKTQSFEAILRSDLTIDKDDVEGSITSLNQ